MTNTQWKNVSIALLGVLILAMCVLAYVATDRSARETQAKALALKEETHRKVRHDYAVAASLADLIRKKDMQIAAHDSQEHLLYEPGDHYKETKAFIAESSRLSHDRQSLAEKYNRITFDLYGCAFETKSGLPETAEETLPCHL